MAHSDGHSGRRSKNRWRLAAITGAISVAAIVSLDVVIGQMWPGGDSIVLPSNFQARCDTSEYSFEINTSSIGIRDREIVVGGHGARAAVRVIAIGDSFTFGWGVRPDEAWPKRMQARLRDSGSSVDVVNLGCPGAGPRTYLEVAERAVSRLSPEVTIIAVLQGDDLAQLAREKASVRLHEPRWIEEALPHLVRLYRTWRSPSDIRRHWRDLAASYLAALDEPERSKLAELHHEVRRAFSDGDLNPGLVRLALSDPDYFRITPVEVFRPSVERLATVLQSLRELCQRHGSKVVVVSVPYGVYVSSRSLETRRRLGFTVHETMLTSAVPDEGIRDAAHVAGVAFHSATAEFRARAPRQPLFFALDGHFNRDGHRLFADVIVEHVRDLIRSDAAGK